MALDPAIALQVQQPNLANTMGSFLDLGAKKLAFDRARATYDADVAQRLAESSSAQSRATVDAANVPQLIRQQAASTRGAEAQASMAELEQMRAYVANARQHLQPLVGKEGVTPDDLQDAIYQTLKNSGAPASAYGQAFSGLPKKGASPEVVQRYITDSLMESQAISTQLDKIAPPPAFINNGQQAVPVEASNPRLSGAQPGTQRGVPVQMKLPPTATTVGPRGEPVYVGEQPQPTRTPVPAGLAPGVAAGIEGPVKTNNDHFQMVAAEAAPAQTRIAALNTIKEEANQAGYFTGGGDWRRRLLSQLSGTFGLKNDEQTANDVMAKNLSVLAQQAGNTDAARTLGEIANPNVHMTKDAIEQTANQLIGIERKKIAAQQAFSGIPTNSDEYTKRMTTWNKVADPRLFEYAGLDDQQKQAFLKKLSPGQRAELAMKARALHDMGVTP